MASLKRDEYLKVLEFAESVFQGVMHGDMATSYGDEAVAIMDMVEECIGQRCERSIDSRLWAAQRKKK